MFTKNKEPGGGAPARGPGRPRGRTDRGRERREELFRTALSLFEERGYEATTLRDIARAAGASPALLYRYFPGKRDVVLELHERLSRDFARRAEGLPRGPWRRRFLEATRASLEVLGPHRTTLRALVPLLVGGAEEGVLAPATAFSRERVEGVFLAAAEGASDAPRGASARALGRLLYLAHLGVLLWWLLDRSTGQRATELLLAFAGRALAPIAAALRLSPTRRLLAELDRAAGLALFGEERAGPAEA